MAKSEHSAFEIKFFENVLKRDPKNAELIEILGGLYTREGRVSDGLRMDRKLVRLMPANATAHYNLACSLALKKRNAEAIRSLRTAIALGYRDFDWLQQDPDLEGLKRSPEFGKLLAGVLPQS